MLIQIPTQLFTSSVTLGRPRALARLLYLYSGNTDTNLLRGALELSP